jgi:AcrR family transcriptional regulator
VLNNEWVHVFEAIMIGLRERQKQSREKRILESAARLFERDGYRDTSIEEIADRAKLATGTVYNYFSSKAELLAAVLRERIIETATAAEALVEDSSSDLSAAVRELMDLYLNLILRHDRALWRELIGAAYLDPGRTASLVLESDLHLVRQVARLLDSYQERGLVRSNLDSRDGAVALYGVCLTAVLTFLTTDAISIKALRSQIAKGVDIVVCGLAPSTGASRGK